MSFVTAKIQQNCTDTGNDNSEATRQRINCAQMACLVDPGASFDTPDTPGSVSIVEISAF